MDNEKNNILDIAKIRSEKSMYDCLKNLTKEQQRAIIWLLYHLDFLDLIDSGRIMVEAEEHKWVEKALETNDYILLALIQYKKCKDKNRIQ